MSQLLTYMKEMRGLLADSFQGNCLTIARDIARMLLDSRRRPSILCLRKTEDRGGDRFHYPLMPKKYGGRVTWTTHYVCCSDGKAYDPMLNDTVPIDDYSRLVFGEDFPIEIFVSEESMRDYLSRF